MNDDDLDLPAVKAAHGDTPAERCCLSCRSVFWSDGFGERICKRCKAQAAWKTSPPFGTRGYSRTTAK